MKELFSYYTFEPDEREIINTAQFFADKYVGQPITPRQLYYLLINENAINGKDTPFPLFYKLLIKGLLGGLVDWEGIVSDEGKTTLRLGTSPREIWIRGAFLEGWLLTKFELQPPTVVHTARLRWSAFHLHQATRRLSKYVYKTGSYTIDYLTDHFSHSDSMYEKFKRKFVAMLRIPIAREIFNQRVGAQLWLPEGMTSSATKSYATLRREAQESIKEAKTLINDRIKFNFLGLKKGSKYAKESYDGRLISLPPHALNAMLAHTSI